MIRITEDGKGTIIASYQDPHLAMRATRILRAAYCGFLTFAAFEKWGAYRVVLEGSATRELVDDCSRLLDAMPTYCCDPQGEE